MKKRCFRPKKMLIDNVYTEALSLTEKTLSQCFLQRVVFDLKNTLIDNALKKMFSLTHKKNANRQWFLEKCCHL